jgi:hypothetical protein
VSGDVLTLAGALRNPHSAEASCSALPTSARLAVIYYAVTELMRPASAAENASKQGPAMSSTSGDTRRTGRSAYYYDEACKLLKPYKRIR